jgi:hypothetical protein
MSTLREHQNLIVETRKMGVEAGRNVERMAIVRDLREWADREEAEGDVARDGEIAADWLRKAASRYERGEHRKPEDEGHGA